MSPYCTILPGQAGDHPDLVRPAGHRAISRLMLLSSHASDIPAMTLPAAPSVSRETQIRLEVFARELARWSKSINLVSRRDLPFLWPRHIEDCLAILPHIPCSVSHAIDLGSGSGLPGLVLAIATGIPFALIESDQRKAAFLIEASRITHAPVNVHACRITDVSIGPAPLVTARALAPLRELLALAYPLVTKDGLCIFPKGRDMEEELTAAKADWAFDLTPISRPSGQLLLIRHLRHA